MAKSLTLQALEKDKVELSQKMQALQRQLSNMQVQLYRLDGALGYIEDNIKSIKGVEEKC